MKFRNRPYSPVEEVNRENDRRMLLPPILLIFAVVFIIPNIVALIVHYGEQIDAFSQKNWKVIGWTLTLVPLALIIRKTIKNYWP